MHKSADYSYELPPVLIAQSPAQQRDASRLMVLGPSDAPLCHGVFRDLPGFLRDGDLLVLNDTKVVRARLACRRETGGRVEALVLGPGPGTGAIDAMLKSRARLREGERLRTDHATATIVLRERKERGRWGIDVEGAELDELFATGRAPLPPYIHRDPVEDAADDADLERYQTVFARTPGAVAAPTAGLHFTREVFDALAARGIETAEITLHVGPGTFLPVRSEAIADHAMLPEYYRIEAAAVERIRAARRRGGRVIAVGTTACRALETAAPSRSEAEVAEGWTSLFVYPGYRFREVDGLLTNFHMPESTLLMLVAALVGRDRILEAYRDAVRLGYRFFSYGDAMLIQPSAKIEPPAAPAGEATE